MKIFSRLLLLALLLRPPIIAASDHAAEHLESAAKSHLDELKGRAEAGDPQAQYEFAQDYVMGEGVTRNDKAADEWFLRAAEQGYAKAQFAVGMRSWFKGMEVVEKDYGEAVRLFKESVKWYQKAAEQGNAEAQSSLGFMYHAGMGVTQNAAEAVRWERMAAEQGLASAQFSLGAAYNSGDGVTKDPVEAVKWFRKAAEKGEADAQFNIGVAYFRGNGVPQDNAESVKWLRMAAEQGQANAQNNLAVMYLKGDGVPKDEIEALAWVYVSAASGEEMAVKKRPLMEHDLGHGAALLAQQRGKEIIAMIERNKAQKIALKSSTNNTSAETSSPKSSGSGTIVTAQGHVLTAAHVVSGATRITAITAKGTMAAKVLRIDESNDIAVLKIDGGPFVPVPIAPSRRARLGQTVATIGFPNVEIQGFSPKVTRGEISSQNGAGDDPRSWQVSVPVQPGNSGGPLLDESGNLIGIVVSKLGIKAAMATGDMPQNVNYAVKSAYALALLEPYLDSNAPEPNQPNQKQTFADMISNAQQSVVLVLVY
jgi:TPR repeat protein